MTHTEGNKIIENVDTEVIITCKHCQKLIVEAKLIGFSLICPLCGKPQNGQPHPGTKGIFNDPLLLNMPLKGNSGDLDFQPEFK
jgi:hypothetical protein